MPVHYDPARIRKRFCPQGHDKYIVGVMAAPASTSKCYACAKITRVEQRKKQYASDPEWRKKHNQRTSRGWQNPKRARRNYFSRLKKRMAAKREKIAELEKELANYGSFE